jgi:hypothetical protein
MVGKIGSECVAKVVDLDRDDFSEDLEDLSDLEEDLSDLGDLEDFDFDFSFGEIIEGSEDVV